MYTYDKSIEARVRALTCITEEQYAELVFNAGIDYLKATAPDYPLKATAPDYPQVISQIARSEIYWNWWRSHWQRRDEQFLEECETWESTPDKYQVVYRNMNDGRTLQSAIYLNGQVLQDSYAETISKITKAQKEAA